MIDYIYDGSYEGLLTAIYEAKYRHEIPNAITTKQNSQQTLFQDIINIETDSDKADRVHTAIKQKLSATALENTYYVYLSEAENHGRIIYDYLELGWKAGKKLDLYLTDESVLRVHNLSRKVMNECHRMLGLIRFRQLSKDLYYSPVELDHNIISLIAPHFVDRFADQNWIIHDLKRNIAAFYNQSEWIIADFDKKQITDYTEDETNYKSLWQKYFKSIAISSRVNPKLQRKNMPARYWAYLVEKEK